MRGAAVVFAEGMETDVHVAIIVLPLWCCGRQREGLDELVILDAPDV